MKALSMLLVLVGLLVATPPVSGEDSITFTQPVVKLWPNGAPGSEGKTAPETWNPSTDGFHRVTNIHDPSLTVFLPPADKANGAAVIICPGGGHQYLVMDLEGSLVAEKLNAMGVAAFILKSRLSRAPGSTYTIEGHSLPDAQRAIRLVRSRAAEWNIKPDRIGIMGFSAGGTLAALTATRFEQVSAQVTDPLEAVSPRPDFVVQVYGGLRDENLTIPAKTPPTFLVVAGDDSPAASMAAYYAKLKAQNIPAELHIYGKGGHGFGMTGRTPAFKELPAAAWPNALQAWLSNSGFTAK